MEAMISEVEAYRSPIPVWLETIGYGIASSTSCGLFFSGSWTDVGFAYVWGSLVCLLGKLPFRGFAELNPFVSAFLVAFSATLVDRFFFSEKNCLYAQVFGGLVWLFPGVTIACSVQELYSNMIVYGSSRLIYAIFQALMLGFGLLAGYRVVYPDRDAPASLKSGCKALTEFNPVSPYFVWLLLPIMSISFNMLMGASRDQQPGMVICAAVAEATSLVLTSFSNLTDAVPLLAALATGIVARIIAWQRGHDYLPYMLGGIVILVPGGVGVHGIAAWASGDSLGGGNFTFAMLAIGVSLAIGLFIAQLPKKNCLVRKGQGDRATYYPMTQSQLNMFIPLVKDKDNV